MLPVRSLEIEDGDDGGDTAKTGYANGVDHVACRCLSFDFPKSVQEALCPVEDIYHYVLRRLGGLHGD